MEKGKILLLNGPSSAGKTTLAWELQTNGPGYWYWLPLDCFLDAVPSQLWDKDHKEGLRTAFGLLHACVKMAADEGKNVIVDTVMCDKDTFASFEATLAGHTVYMVKVTCPLEELARREQARGDRDIGLAASQAQIMVPQQSYDLIVDTHAHTAAECASQVMDMLAAGRPVAFERLAANPDRWGKAASQAEML